jgi:hypothetical protein
MASKARAGTALSVTCFASWEIPDADDAAARRRQ